MTTDWAPEPTTPEPDTTSSQTADLNLLAEPPSTASTADLHVALSGPPASARAVKATRVLIGGMVLVLGFLAGVLVDQQWGAADTAISGPPADRGSGIPGGTLAGDGVPGAAGSGSAGVANTAGTTTTGTVTLVDGSVIYVTDPAGTLVRVEVSDSTDATETASISMKELSEGDTVTVTGTTSDDGLTATSVEVQR